MNCDVLIIGADSLIGGALAEESGRRGISVTGTSRRESRGYYFLDLSKPINCSDLPAARTVFLCAGINGFAACNGNPAMAARVNISATLEVAVHYMTQGAHVVFLSSSAVFGARTDTPAERDAPSPDSTYGAFKCATEVALLEKAKTSRASCSVVRLTKVLSAASPLMKKWLELGKLGVSVQAFSDAYLSPVSLDYVVHGLLRIAEAGVAGCFHLAGLQTHSYFELAQALGKKGVIPASLVSGISQGIATESSQALSQCIGLAMPDTTRILNIQPQPFTDFLNGLC